MSEARSAEQSWVRLSSSMKRAKASSHGRGSACVPRRCRRGAPKTIDATRPYFSSARAADALAVDRELVDPDVEDVRGRARQVLPPTDENLRELGQLIRVVGATVVLGGRVKGRMFHAVGPETALVVFAVVQPLDA